MALSPHGFHASRRLFSDDDCTGPVTEMIPNMNTNTNSATETEIAFNANANANSNANAISTTDADNTAAANAAFQRHSLLENVGSIRLTAMQRTICFPIQSSPAVSLYHALFHAARESPAMLYPCGPLHDPVTLAQDSHPADEDDEMIEDPASIPYLCPPDSRRPDADADPPDSSTVHAPEWLKIRHEFPQKDLLTAVVREARACKSKRTIERLQQLGVFVSPKSHPMMVPDPRDSSHEVGLSPPST